jgi:hypothetical protein
MEYRVLTAADDTSLLQDRLRGVAEAKGRVVNVMWRPAAERHGPMQPAYVIVAEFPGGASPS